MKAEAILVAWYSRPWEDCPAALMIIIQNSMPIDEYLDTIHKLVLENSITDDIILMHKISTKVLMVFRNQKYLRSSG